MANLKEKTSFILKFTIAALVLIAFVVIILMLVFFINLRSVTNRQTETIVSERVANLQKSVVNTFKNAEKILLNTAYGISTLYNQGDLNQQELVNYFSSVAELDSKIQMIYFSGNNLWYEPNGFWAATPDWTPPQGWDNTARPWFIGAKNSSSEIAYSEPYTSAFSDNFVIALSTEVFDKNKNSIGVIGIDVIVAELNTLLNTSTIIAKQKLYLLNKDGFFITHNDDEAIMAKNFFDESAFAKYKNEILSSAVFSKIDDHEFFYSAHMPVAGWTLVSTIPVSVIYTETNSLILRLVILSLVILVGIAFISILFTYRLMESQHKKEIIEEKKFARNLVSIRKVHYQEMKEMSRKFSILHHDFKHHVKVVDELLQADNMKEAKQYLMEFKEQIPEGDFNYYCYNQTMNALLSSYAKRCKEFDIQYKVRIELPETLHISDYDICTILGNLLENAFEASRKIEVGREIEIAIKTNAMRLTIMAKNRFDGVVISKKDGEMASSKKDGGLGLPGIRAVVDAYDGHVTTEWSETHFTVYVMLNFG